MTATKKRSTKKKASKKKAGKKKYKAESLDLAPNGRERTPHAVTPRLSDPDMEALEAYRAQVEKASGLPTTLYSLLRPLIHRGLRAVGHPSASDSNA